MSSSVLQEWAPFRIDALGLVTIFGAEQMDVAVGNLVESWVTDWLPILGSYVVASNKITSPNPGFVLYNITDGIVATDVSPWFTRWLMSYPLTYAATTITLRGNARPMHPAHLAISIVIGGLAALSVILLTAMTRDWWGIANISSLLVSVATRQLVVAQLRASIDQTMRQIIQDLGEDVKIFLTMPDGRAVTIRGSRKIVTSCLLTNPRPPHPRAYFLARVLCWLAFGIHAVSLGMSMLIHQIVSVVILLGATAITAGRVADRSSNIGSHLVLDVDPGDANWFRSPVYARLGMTPTEEDCMIHWNLLPQRTNEFWWTRYRMTYFGPQLNASTTDGQASVKGGKGDVNQASTEPDPKESTCSNPGLVPQQVDAV
ncbi:hypothetical protein S40288_11190 [Stachybotrys chartarum IBT 40288]|nr:hypothetical protein S40288_11190 [Stachybotrys chartarum IBT 40288]